MQNNLPYPRATSRKTDPMTSHEASKRFKIRRNSQRFLLLYEFVQERYNNGPGISDEEATKRSGIKNDSGHKRASELRNLGYLITTGVKEGEHGCKVRTHTASESGVRAYEMIRKVC